ncbi:hypothetical protein I302_106178 [Kwoniella bestiolae CBS 10118]|uniref:DNA helicase n=1 Tax=Kwoniella bestiolae CBS 10118 TaxID=1296100 RepID=A0A1B9G3A3_9TREE|nr:hypothetical protein I302_05302 [Kwoniella bestiolae CBS 10118]OCF25482.1 hypothetical protein I302_05302 [Kwoniella bestiolae CBS 10118]
MGATTKRKVMDQANLEQGEFDISPQMVDELYRSSNSTDGMDEIPLDMTEEEILGLMESMSESTQEDVFGSESELVPPLDELPLPEISDPFAPSPSTSTKQLITVSPTREPRHLPALTVPIPPPNHQTRFDWRTRALSQQRKKPFRGYWFGNLPKRREENWGKLQFGQEGREELDRYAKHFIPLLEAEQAEEERLFNSRIAEWSFDRLRREGYALDEMRGSKGYQPKSLMGLGTVYGFVRGKGDRELPFNRFTIGSNVILSRTDPQVDAVGATADGKNKLIGSVWNCTKGNLRIMFPQEIEDIDSGHWRLDVACSDFAVRRQIEAIKSLNLDPYQQDMGDFPDDPDPSDSSSTNNGARTPEGSAGITALSTAPVLAKDKKDQTILRGTAIRDLLFRAFQEDYTPASHSRTSAGQVHHHTLPTDHIVQDTSEMRLSDLDAIPEPIPDRTPATGILAKNQLIQSWTERYRRPGQPVEMEGDPKVGLNESQLKAIAMMLSERLSLVQGPPGTGKTRVIIETIKLLKKHWQIPHPILVTAHTNVAVDNLLSGLRAHDIKALRFGAVNRIPEEFGDWTLDRMIGKHPRWWNLEMARKEKDLLVEKRLKGVWSGEDEARLIKVGQKIWVIRQSIMREVLLDADVICTTCLSATSKALQGIDFPIVFLDEASMATEPLSLVPLTKGSAHVAIIGDHKQLPPVIVSPEAHAGGLATSLFERLIHEGDVPSTMLDTQYRMHPTLSSFPSQTFYSGLLKDGTSPSQRLPPETEFLVKDEQTGMRKNITFLNHDHPESPISKSIANYADAEYACDVIADLMYKNPSLKGSQIGIITPYISQLRLLSNELTEPARLTAFRELLGDARARELEDIEIKTVDGFEGREKEVIIFSCVRCNDAGWIGFLGDWRRVNVAMTRGRRALIMIGSKRTLQKARMGKTAEETLPSGGARVWRDLVGWLESEGCILDA